VLNVALILSRSDARVILREHLGGILGRGNRAPIDTFGPKQWTPLPNQRGLLLLEGLLQSLYSTRPLQRFGALFWNPWEPITAA
jgi:hypothetical protein